MTQYVLEWSRNSNTFHIQQIENALARNQERFINDEPHDYIVLMIGSHDVVTQMAAHHRDRLKERKPARKTVWMTGKALSKLDTKERNDLIGQIGAVELVG